MKKKGGGGGGNRAGSRENSDSMTVNLATMKIRHVRAPIKQEIMRSRVEQC